jgi:flagellin
MSMVIGTNISSLTAQRHLAASKNDMENAMERLASGSRINSSRDDAAGLAIAGRMESQISGLNQGIRNANDGIALAQSAEGALDETTSILQRMRDLSVQASSDTLTTSDRSSIQSELTALTSEIDRISSSTTFNNKALLDGSATALQFQVGSGAGQSVGLSVSSASAANLGLADGGSTGAANAITGTRMTTTTALFENSVEINGQNWANDATPTDTVGASLTVTDANGISVAALSSTADGVAAIINENTVAHGAVATATNKLVSTGFTGSVTTSVDSMTINGTTIDNSDSLESLIANINKAGTGVTATATTGTGYELTNTTGENIVVGGTITGSGLTAATYIGYLSLSNTDGSATTITKGSYSTAEDANVNTLGFNARSAASTIETKDITGSSLILDVDDLTLNGVSLGASGVAATSESAATLAAHLNAKSTETNVQVTASSQVTLNMSTTNVGDAYATVATANDTLTVNGVATTLTANMTMAAMVTLFNTNHASTGIEATSVDGGLVLTSALGDTIGVQESTALNIASYTLADGSTQAIGAADTNIDFFGNLKMVNTAGGDIKFDSASQTDAELTTTLAKLGMTLQGDAPAAGTAGSAVSVATSASASAAITAIDAALEKVFASRGDLGAFQNRLDHTVSNLRNVSENTAFSKSQIQDTDFATESANLAKAQVLQQAGTAMLAQANASGQSVLSLLK